MIKRITAILAATIIILLGFFLPLGSYTTVNGCPADETPTTRLSVVSGDSLKNVQNNDVVPQPNVGCSVNTKYVLYLF